MAVTTGNGGAPDKKWLNFRVVMSDVNLNPSINRIAKNIWPGSDDDYQSLTRPQKLELINQHLIKELKMLSRVNHIEPDIKAAEAQVIAQYDAMIDLSEEA